MVLYNYRIYVATMAEDREDWQEILYGIYEILDKYLLRWQWDNKDVGMTVCAGFGAEISGVWEYVCIVEMCLPESMEGEVEQLCEELKGYAMQRAVGLSKHLVDWRLI